MTVKYKCTSKHADIKQVQGKMGMVDTLVYDTVLNKTADSTMASVINIQTTDKSISEQFEVGIEYEVIIGPMSMVAKLVN